jgi:hypothetical protein
MAQKVAFFAPWRCRQRGDAHRLQSAEQHTLMMEKRRFANWICQDRLWTNRYGKKDIHGDHLLVYRHRATRPHGLPGVRPAKNALTSQFFLCLSRACLGKKIVYINIRTASAPGSALMRMVPTICLQKNTSSGLSRFPSCLSRACLGKRSFFPISAQMQ